MGAIIAALSAAMQFVPQLVQIGIDVMPLVNNVRQAIDNMGDSVSPDDEEFKKLDALVKEYEADFQAAVDARLAVSGTRD